MASLLFPVQKCNVGKYSNRSIDENIENVSLSCNFCEKMRKKCSVMKYKYIA